jgi:uncharacterized protein (DUF1499 family)
VGGEDAAQGGIRISSEMDLQDLVFYLHVHSLCLLSHDSIQEASVMNKHVPIILVVSMFLTGCSGTMPKLGIENGLLMRCPNTPNCVNSQATDEKHFIQPIEFTGTRQAAQGAILKLLETSKRTRIIVAEEDYIRAEFTSMIFRFVDDVEFYLPLSEKEETIIHVRSASRIGYSDFGVNRKRIENIRGQLKQTANESE